eukprot:scaffold47951_cov31-Tisochrysis_lutea.AAC.2
MPARHDLGHDVIPHLHLAGDKHMARRAGAATVGRRTVACLCHIGYVSLGRGSLCLALSPLRLLCGIALSSDWHGQCHGASSATSLFFLGQRLRADRSVELREGDLALNVFL